MEQDLLYKLALTRVPQIGSVFARNLLSHFECAKDVFKCKFATLTKLEGVGEIRAHAIKNFNEFDLVEKELAFSNKHEIAVIDINNENYPKKLKNCVDAPIVIFYKGNANLNTQKIISVIGRRKSTNYGQRIVEELMREIAEENVLIVSGLAHGIDSIAHKNALQNKLATVAVLAHGLDRIYPPINRGLAKEMLHNGGLLTEYWSGTLPDKQNFPTRNRIVAGISDATIVIETDIKGGSMITASLANGYNKDVLAYPGDIFNNTSKGCNYLIKTHRAHTITEAKDIFNLLGWQNNTSKKIQKELFIVLEPMEQKIYDYLNENGPSEIDFMLSQIKMSPSVFAGAALSLELQNILLVLPGKIYKLAN